MSKIRLQGPENFGGFSHDGQNYAPDDDGIVELPAHLPNEVLAAHGLKPAEGKKGPKKLEPLAKAKGEDVDNDKPIHDDVKPAQKGAKAAKGGAE